ncbi:hypothetical protein LTR86_010993 [Recurvomyces mirabilis]|nr:hypothetical protein LTR86_010993 [Recurvomyces mirabilis]
MLAGCCSKEEWSDEDIFSTQTPEATAALIADHTWWKKGLRRDNLVSWSSSMLFLIPYIFHRHHDSNDGSSLRDIRLLVIDTEKLPARTFIRDTDLISAFKQFDSREKAGLGSMAGLRNDTHHYFGEYLSQGSLNISGKCITVSAQTMIDRGLFDLHDVFIEAYGRQQQATWVKSVHTARETIEFAPKLPQALLETMSSAFNIALEFGEAFRLPIAVQLLALLPFALDPTLVYGRLWAHIRPTKILLQTESILSQTVPVLSEYSPEHSTVADMLQGAAHALQDAYSQLERGPQ